MREAEGSTGNYHAHAWELMAGGGKLTQSSSPPLRSRSASSALFEPVPPPPLPAAAAADLRLPPDLFADFWALFDLVSLLLPTAAAAGAGGLLTSKEGRPQSGQFGRPQPPSCTGPADRTNLRRSGLKFAAESLQACVAKGQTPMSHVRRAVWLSCSPQLPSPHVPLPAL